jgi:hypothetical protein
MLPMIAPCLQLRRLRTHRFDMLSFDNGRKLAPEEKDRIPQAR